MAFIPKMPKEIKPGTEFIERLPSNFGKKALSCRLKSLNDILCTVEWFQHDFWAFRGQYDATWSLSSSLERKQRKHPEVHIGLAEEMAAILDFRNQTRLLLPYTERLIETLAAMQHYGIPTRLIDFTRSFFVALFFAFEKGESKDVEDHSVWAINIGRSLEHSKLIEDYILKEIDVASRASIENNQEELIEVTTCVHDGLLDELNSDVHVRTVKTMELADRLLQGAYIDVCSGILPVDIPGVNPRMAAQNGMFIMATDLDPFEKHLVFAFELNDNLNSLPNVSPEYVGQSLRESDDLAIVKLMMSDDLRRQLECLFKAANISSARLFPDLSDLAAHISYNNTAHGSRSPFLTVK